MNLERVKGVDCMVGRVVTEQLNGFLNAGYTLMKVESGGINGATRVYYLVNLNLYQDAMLNDISYPVTLLISRSGGRVTQRIQGVDLFEVDEYTVGVTTLSSDVANTCFLDSLYEKNVWEVLFRGYTKYGSSEVYPTLEDLVNCR